MPLWLRGILLGIIPVSVPVLQPTLPSWFSVSHCTILSLTRELQSCIINVHGFAFLKLRVISSSTADGDPLEQLAAIAGFPKEPRRCACIQATPLCMSRSHHLVHARIGSSISRSLNGTSSFSLNTSAQLTVTWLPAYIYI